MSLIIALVYELCDPAVRNSKAGIVAEPCLCYSVFLAVFYLQSSAGVK